MHYLNLLEAFYKDKIYNHLKGNANVKQNKKQFRQ